MNTPNTRAKTVLISGGSRGIGEAIALTLAREWHANIAILAKTTDEGGPLAGTIYSVAKAVEALGGRALPIQCDIRSEDAVKAAIAKTVETFGGIDVVVNSASAIFLEGTLEVEPKRLDLMMDINYRGTYRVIKHALPHLMRSDNPHILSLSPPVPFSSYWFGLAPGYSIAKACMSQCTLAVAEEFRAQRIAANCLWPETTIDTAALRRIPNGEATRLMSRTPQIMADAALEILGRPSSECTGNCFIDVPLIRAAGKDPASYAVTPGGRLQRDMFVDDWCQGTAEQLPPTLLQRLGRLLPTQRLARLTPVRKLLHLIELYRMQRNSRRR
jgi:citronellol/citronellal dehydrogenase